jgi:hypothetical protein
MSEVQNRLLGSLIGLYGLMTTTAISGADHVAGVVF